jgi:hypothetical protein
MMAPFGIDLKPLERGMDSLVRMADALEDLVKVGKELVALQKKQGGR